MASDPFRERSTGPGALPAAANPFAPGMGKVPPAFGGRYPVLLIAKDMIDRLESLADPGHMPLLRGVRGVGKTALMAYVRRQAEERRIVALHVEADKDDHDLDRTCRGLVRDAAELADGIGKEMAKRLAAVRVGKASVEFHPPSTDPAAAVEDVLHDLVLMSDKKRRALLITVDEVHEAEETLLRPLVRAVHRHSQDGKPLGVILSGLPNSLQTLMAEGQTYTERLDSHELGMLDRDAVAEAIRTPFADAVGASVSNKVIDMVFDDSGGYPFFVQLWGEALWSVAARLDRIDAKDAERATARMQARREAFFEDRLRRVPSGRATELVTVMADLSTPAASGTAAKELGLKPSQLSAARQSLLHAGIIWSPAWGELDFTVPGFGEWLKRRRGES